MSDWKSRLKNIVHGEHKDAEQLSSEEKAKRRVHSFIRFTVLPAFRELASELEGSGRSTEIQEGERGQQAHLLIYRDGEEEFRYGVRGRIYRRKAPAFPVVQEEQDDDPRDIWVEVDLPSGTVSKARVDEFFAEDLMDDFLEQYEKWLPY